MTFAWLSVMVTLLISHQFADDKTMPAMREMVKIVKSLEDFSVVKIEDAAAIRIVQGDSNQLYYGKLNNADADSTESEVIQEYLVRNDTLYIRNLRQGRYGSYTLEVNDLKHLIVLKSWEVDLVGFDQDSLSITSLNSKVMISKQSEFSYLCLKSGRKFDLVFSSPRNLALTQTDSRVELSGKVDKISGVVGNYAELIIPSKIGKLNLDTSENGKLTLK